MDSTTATAALENFVQVLLENGGELELGRTVLLLSKRSRKFVSDHGALEFVKRFRQVFSYIRRRRSRVMVKLDVRLEFCPKAAESGECADRKCFLLHLCPFFVKESCKFGNQCKRSHNYRDEHTIRVLRHLRLDFLNSNTSLLQKILKVIVDEGEIQRAATNRLLPEICKFYNKATCDKGDRCPFLHVCEHFIDGDCKFAHRCRRDHDFSDEHNKRVLEEYDMDGISDRQVLRRLEGRERKRTVSASSDASGDNNVEEDTEICGFNLHGRCNYGNSCIHYHAELPYIWQFAAEGDGKWESFSSDLNMMLEYAYCDVKNDTSSPLPISGFLYHVDFQDMTAVPLITHAATNVKSVKVRRLSTVSSVLAATDDVFSTRWQWYWKDENDKWQSYDTPADGHAVNTTSSLCLERDYVAGKESHSFSAGHHQYTLCFEKWCQKNDVHKTERPVRRRPAEFLSKLNMQDIAQRSSKPAEEKPAFKGEDEDDASIAKSSLLTKVLKNKLDQNKNKVEVQRNDPSSPLPSVKSFEELPLSHQCTGGVDEEWAAEVDEQERQITGQVNQLQINREDDGEDEDDATVAAESSLLIKGLRNKLVQNKNEVEVQRNDPSSPLHSVKSFEELPLSEQLRRGVYGMGFNKPSKIQGTSLPMLLADPPNNLIVQSYPGTGKTAAFVLSMLSKVDATKNFPQVICLSPTYELAFQTGQMAEKMGKFCPEVKIGYAVRGEKVSRGQKATDQVIFGTPGTLLDWILRNRAFDPKKIKMFVLDEADLMITLTGHQDQFIRIHKTLPKDCQMLLFSPTCDDEQVMKFATTVVPDPIIIRLRLKEGSLDNIKQFYVVCRDKEDKFQALSNMYCVVSIGQCIVFCHTRKAASWLAQKMTEDGHAVALLSGEITVEQRIAVLNRFRDGKEKLLITTNVCARGIDVEQVTVVVNYDMPVDPNGKPDFETYLRRICQTGRFGKSGIVVNLIDGQRSMAAMKRIEEHFGKKITILETNVDALEKLA